MVNPMDQGSDEQRIRVRAYEAWEKAGRPDGFSYLFWKVGEAVVYREQFPFLNYQTTGDDFVFGKAAGFK